MIVSINTELLATHEEEIQVALSKIIDLLFEDRFIWDVENVSDFFIDRESLVKSQFFVEYLSQYQKEKLLNKRQEIILKSAYQTILHNKYLTRIIIGTAPGEIPPNIAWQILKLESRVILENGQNDWKFILGIVDKYLNHKERKSIYKLIKKSIDQMWIEPENAGGVGGIRNRFKALAQGRYKGVIKYKICSLFDSDRDSNMILQDEQREIIRAFKADNKVTKIGDAVCSASDQISWHMLYKRSIENYIPVEILAEYLPIPPAYLERLATLTSDEYDFYKFVDMQGIEIKQELPELFLKHWTKDKMEKRCESHLFSIELPNATMLTVSEIEIILLKLATII